MSPSVLDHPRPARASLAAARIPEAGDTLDHYRIDELTACTALAFIFRGTDLGSGRKVAIKIPRVESVGDPDLCACFLREDKIGRKLHHPGVISVLRDGERSQLYVVTEWIDGRSLRRVLDEHRHLSPDRAARIAANICDALYYVHSRGVVHRDLKPENVLVCADDRIKLIDFGIAVAGGSERMELARSSETAGTPDYISPEEVKGIRGNARSDIYALGVILFEMLTGKFPFDGCNSLAVMNDRLFNDPAPVRTIKPEVPLWLEQIIQRALQRDPKRRYTSAFEFGRDLKSEGRCNPEAQKSNRWPFPWFWRTN